MSAKVLPKNFRGYEVFCKNCETFTVNKKQYTISYCNNYYTSHFVSLKCGFSRIQVCLCASGVCLYVRVIGRHVVFNECSPSLGGMVVKEVIRPLLSTTQQQAKPPKKRPPKQSSTSNISQGSKSSKSNSKLPPAKQKELKLELHVEDHSLEVVDDEDDTKNNIMVLPVSPRKKEPLGVGLLKVCMHI